MMSITKLVTPLLTVLAFMTILTHAQNSSPEWLCQTFYFPGFDSCCNLLGCSNPHSISCVQMTESGWYEIVDQTLCGPIPTSSSCPVCDYTVTSEEWLCLSSHVSGSDNVGVSAPSYGQYHNYVPCCQDSACGSVHAAQTCIRTLTHSNSTISYEVGLSGLCNGSPAPLECPNSCPPGTTETAAWLCGDQNGPTDCCFTCGLPQPGYLCTITTNLPSGESYSTVLASEELCWGLESTSNSASCTTIPGTNLPCPEPDFQWLCKNDWYGTIEECCWGRCGLPFIRPDSSTVCVGTWITPGIDGNPDTSQVSVLDASLCTQAGFPEPVTCPECVYTTTPQWLCPADPNSLEYWESCCIQNCDLTAPVYCVQVITDDVTGFTISTVLDSTGDACINIPPIEPCSICSPPEWYCSYQHSNSTLVEYNLCSCNQFNFSRYLVEEINGKDTFVMISPPQSDICSNLPDQSGQYTINPVCIQKGSYNSITFLPHSNCWGYQDPLTCPCSDGPIQTIVEWKCKDDYGNFIQCCSDQTCGPIQNYGCYVTEFYQDYNTISLDPSQNACSQVPPPTCPCVTQTVFEWVSTPACYTTTIYEDGSSSTSIEYTPTQCGDLPAPQCIDPNQNQSGEGYDDRAE